MPPISNDWLVPLKQEFSKPYYAKLYRQINEEYKNRVIYPPADDIFNAFAFTPLSEVKVVILGQDPYHEELHEDCGCYIPNNGYLTKWAGQGVLLLNTVLTVRAHQANSHRGIGWEEFTDAAIRAVNQIERSIVYLLWGRPAQAKKSMLNNPQHLVLEAPHPSPLSAYRGFFGCRHFSRANKFLKNNGIDPIDWQIENI
ncbi:MAG: uracil-DNA glycosylase [Lachnospiraceae bacterium]|nr:uracil-DNA glycosylase [Lachnospiraceae bacterium]